ncbi:HNH endonuclease [Burkholderia gladioli]|uniref:HNH endonuclease n=1 Tax=Burkholderia gladioli TaxID=28095 RepID=UPI00155F69D4|nr:HNH endonuclease [Burkholderia gladioli]NRF88429.1 HNH endonuclease [Burkholderia gladioli]
MSATSEIVAALQAAGVVVNVTGPRATQGSVATVGGHPRAVRLYAWQVTDNGRATGTARPADERRIQAIGSRTQLIDASPDPETVVLGWCDEFGPEPLIVAFNPYSVARRVNGKIERKIAAGSNDARASDSQQFRQALLDQASAEGIAVGPNQHGEYVVAMKPSRFIDYLSAYKPMYHTIGAAAARPVAIGRSMGDLVTEAEGEEAAPPDIFETALPQAFDPGMIEDGRERVAREIAIRRGQAVFRRQLLNAYGCCAMSGSTVVETLEAAHIVPYQGPGTNHPSNGLLLRADLHTLFDLGLLAVVPQTLTILVATQLNGTEYEALRGQPLRVDHGSVSPSREALQVHRNFAGI